MKIQQHLTTNSLTWNEIELDLFRALQNAFAELFTALLEDIDRQLAETRDKRRYHLKNKRRTTIQPLFGEVTFQRNYYLDREQNRYTFLLDSFLAFDGLQSISPCLICDYREWLKEQGVDPTGMYPMGRAESVMSQLAYRVKYRHSWTDKGLGAFFKAMIARMDRIRLFGRRWGEESSQPAEETTSTASTKQTIVNKSKQHVRRLLPEVTRNNVPYLQQSSGTPIYHALSEHKGW